MGDESTRDARAGMSRMTGKPSRRDDLPGACNVMTLTNTKQARTWVQGDDWMSLSDYRKTIEELCVQAGIANAAAVLHRGALKFADHSIRLQYCDESDLCRIFIDLGAPVGADLAVLYQLLLEANVDDYSEFVPVHGIHPESGHIVLILHVPMRRLQSDVNLFQLLTSSLDDVFETWSDVLKHGAVKKTDSSVDLLPGCNLA